MVHRFGVGYFLVDLVYEERVHLPTRHSGDIGVYEVQAAFERSYSKYVGLAEKNGWTKNDSAIDFNVAKDLLKQRLPADTVGQALKDFSPDLSRRHKDVDSYIEKTIESAKRGMDNGYKI